MQILSSCTFLFSACTSSGMLSHFGFMFALSQQLASLIFLLQLSIHALYNAAYLHTTKTLSGLCHLHKAPISVSIATSTFKADVPSLSFPSVGRAGPPPSPPRCAVLGCFSTDCVSLICHTSLRSGSDGCCITFPAHPTGNNSTGFPRLVCE